MQYDTPTPVQERVIPAILSGRDVIASAQTGTGKTAAFLLPVLHHILQSDSLDATHCLILVPTRELAIQIAQQIEGFSYFAPVSSLAIYGGNDGAAFAAEKRALTSGSDILVCTPGRLISHLNLGYADFSKLKCLVLDEADRMLDMGFLGDILKILSYLPEKRQSLLFSATMPGNIRELARRILSNPLEVSINMATPPDQIKQEAIFIDERRKSDKVVEIIQSDPTLQSILVFCQTKADVKKLSQSLTKKMGSVGEIHSDLDQSSRENVLNLFKSRQMRVLVATDILSRGIDVEDIDLVINYQVPRDAEDYVHRVGRTARAKSKGRACTLVSPEENRKFVIIQKFLGSVIHIIESTPETSYGSGRVSKVLSKPSGGSMSKNPSHFRRKRNGASSAGRNTDAKNQ